MSIKKILMAAVAVSALSAGAASAASITATEVSNVPVTLGASPVAYRIASETKFGTGLLTTTTNYHNESTVTVGAGQLGVGTYTVTYTLSGPASYQTALLNSSLANNAGISCIVGSVLASGGAIAGTTVTYSVTLSGTCSTSTTANASDKGPSTFTLDAPLKVTGLGSVTLTAGLAQGGVSIDNGTSAAVTLISNTAGFTTSAAADTTATNWLLGTGVPYLTLTADNTIGTYTVNSVNGIYVTADAASLASNENLTADLSLAGDFTNITATAAGPLVSVSPFSTATLAAQPKTASQAITVAITNTNTVPQSAKAFSLTVTPKTTSALFTVPAAFTTALQSISLEGINYLAPWVGGNQSAANTSIRLSNSGVATGAVTLQLAAPVRNAGTVAGATTCTSSTLAKLASIASGAELVIAQADLTTCFGDFKRGDLTITIQASSTSLTAKARNVNAASGDVAEISLGASAGHQ
jgi:hypothetical protein